MLDAFDRNEEVVVFMNQSATDIERYVADKSIQPLKKTAKNNTDKFSEIRRKLKDKEIKIERDLRDAEQFVNSYVIVEDRLKQVDEKMKEIKEDCKEPEEIRKNLETSKVMLTSDLFFLSFSV